MEHETHTVAIRAEESAKSAHKRLDDMEGSLQNYKDTEIKGLREKTHDLYSKYHTVAAITVGMEGAVKGLTANVKEWAEKTEENTQTQIKNRTTVVVALVVAGTMGTGFASFIVFVGGKLLRWW